MCTYTEPANNSARVKHVQSSLEIRYYSNTIIAFNRFYHSLSVYQFIENTMIQMNELIAATLSNDDHFPVHVEDQIPFCIRLELSLLFQITGNKLS